MRQVATHALALYLGAGIFGGTLMAQAIPAMNWLAVAVYAALWPGFVYCAPVARDCDVMDIFPMWAQSLMFTF